MTYVPGQDVGTDLLGQLHQRCIIRPEEFHLFDAHRIITGIPQGSSPSAWQVLVHNQAATASNEASTLGEQAAGVTRQVCQVTCGGCRSGRAFSNERGSTGLGRRPPILQSLFFGR